MKKILALFGLAALLTAFTAKAAPSFDGKTIDSFGKDTITIVENGRKFTLGSFKGKPLFLVIMSSTCGYCEIILSDLRDLKEKYGSKFTVVAVSSEPMAKLKKHRKYVPDSVVFAQISPKAKIVSFYDSPAVPRSVGFVSDGRAAFAGEGANPMFIKLMEILIVRGL